VKRSGKYSIDDIENIIVMLMNDFTLPKHIKDHALSGSWQKIQARECHVKPDLLLVYAKPGNELHLLRLASHAELF
jgi:mRNA interferase YafQ